MFRIGLGNDIHRLVQGRALVLGGVEIASEFGAEGHSDADALTHAITDAILGALALGDIGQHFSDNDELWRNAESLKFLRFAVGLIKERGYRVVNVDSVVSLEKPKLSPYIGEIRESLAAALEVEAGMVSVKAKTNEKMDAVGRGEAIRAEAVVLLESA